MRSAEPLAGAQLMRLLLAALALGGGNACKYVPARQSTEIRPPWLAAEHELAAGQAMSEDECAQLCQQPVARCYLATVEIATRASPPAAPSQVAAGGQARCSAHDQWHTYRPYLRPLPAELARLPQVDRRVVIPAARCEQLCLPLGVDEEGLSYDGSCTTFPLDRSGPVRPDELFVACVHESSGGLRSTIDIVGPLPAGRVARATPGFANPARSASEYCAQAAYFEALSIASFRELARDLRALAAPHDFVERVLAFALDEARHSRELLRVGSALAGAMPPGRAKLVRGWPKLARSPRVTRTLVELALENVRAGCVGETYGAWLALQQREDAADARLRELTARIAEDEAAHAAFALELHAWLWPQLDEAEQQAVRLELEGALRDLERPLPVTSKALRAVGLPGATRLARGRAAIGDLLGGLLTMSSAAQVTP